MTRKFLLLLGALLALCAPWAAALAQAQPPGLDAMPHRMSHFHGVLRVGDGGVEKNPIRP